VLRSGEELAVHVMPSTAKASMVRASIITAGAWGNASDYAAIAVMVAATTALGKLAEPLIGIGGVDLLYLLPVIVGAGRFGLRPGLVAGLAAALAYNFFFLPPIHTFTIADPQSVLTMFVLLGIAAFTANLAGRLKTRATLGTRSAQENAAVAAFGQMLARVSDWATTSEIVCEEIARLLELNVLLFNSDGGTLRVAAASPATGELGPVNMAAADWAWSRGEPSGAGTGTLNAADWQFHPLKTALGVLAVVGVSRPDGRIRSPQIVSCCSRLSWDRPRWRTSG
jgi:two-component system sensor histidine kinase KdpD